MAGDVLAGLGDPRFEPRLFDLPGDKMLGFVPIPADPAFRLGTSSSDADRVGRTVDGHVSQHEINDHVTPTAAFYIGRYAVTVAQFKAFVDATGQEVGDPDALTGPDNRPVRWVNWREALAYCQWLNRVLASSPEFADSEISALVRHGGWSVNLPSELEWEKAARGGGNAIFPWGDDPDPDRANYRNTRMDAASPVGCFPPNSYGLFDIVGNVFAWTRSLWGPNFASPTFRYPYDPADRRREDLAASDEVLRIVRGGSWLNPLESARCACRDRFYPNLRNDYVGFRVALVRTTDAAILS
jgi:formylglycine-generating enzyme required for sulfatase activity